MSAGGRPGRLVLLGHPVAHSLSPLMQAAALERAGIALRYEALDVPPLQLTETLAALRAERAAGNVTIPHKRAVAAACARVSEAAHRTGAVNTFWHEDGVLAGDNTDPVGYRRLVESLALAAPPRRVALIGAGGGAAAVCEAAAAWGAQEVRVWSRSTARRQELAARYPGLARAPESLADALRGADLVANATPVGLHDDTFPAAIEALPDDAAVTDLVYRAGETAWVRAARAAGHPAADGIVMLVEQGAEAFRRWFGVQPDREAMWAAIRGSVAARRPPVHPGPPHA